MNDAQPEEQTAPNGLIPEGSNSDVYLAFLIKIISDLGKDHSIEADSFSISISVVVGGQMWTGQLVSAVAWSAHVASQVRTTTNPIELAEPFATIFDRFKEFDQDARDSGYPFGYVHLLNAVPVLFDGRNAVGGFPIRFRLTDVQGWTMGSPQTSIG